MDVSGEPSSGHGERRRDDGRDERPACDEPGCDRPGAVRLHVPWADDRTVCPPHARVQARPDGVVAEPLPGAEDEWP